MISTIYIIILFAVAICFGYISFLIFKKLDRRKIEKIMLANYHRNLDNLSRIALAGGSDIDKFKKECIEKWEEQKKERKENAGNYQTIDQ